MAEIVVVGAFTAKPGGGCRSKVAIRRVCGAGGCVGVSVCVPKGGVAVWGLV